MGTGPLRDHIARYSYRDRTCDATVAETSIGGSRDGLFEAPVSLGVVRSCDLVCMGTNMWCRNSAFDALINTSDAPANDKA